jgi:hypothetical protein
MSYASDVLALSPIGYWRLAEPSGTTAADETANNRDGTVSGATVGQAGIPAGGGAYLFDGSNDFVGITSHADFDFTGTSAFTVVFWMNTAAAPGTTRFVVAKNANDGSATRQGWGVRHHTSGSIESVRYLNGTGEFDNSGVAVGVDAWHMVAFVVDGSTVQVFLDGVGATADAIATSLLANPGDLKIGSGDATGFYAGYLAEVAIFASALSEATIDALYASGTTPPGQTALPASDVSDGGWTDQAGGTSLFAAIDEATASDADYVKSGVSPGSADECKVRVAALTDPAVHTGHDVDYRYGKDLAGGDQINLTVNLYDADGTTLIATNTHTNIADGWTDGGFTLSEAEAGNITGYASGLVLGFSAVKP